jgi:REP-associated tyrosine transposase
MPYWRLFYHLVWTTKNRVPLIVPEIEDQVYKIIAQKCIELGGWSYATNGMPEHVHMVAAIPPKISPSELARHVKGISSHFVVSKFEPAFAWQRGYGIFSLSKRGLKSAVEYVQNQKAHHSAGSTIAALEYTSDQDSSPVHEG